MRVTVFYAEHICTSSYRREPLRFAGVDRLKHTYRDWLSRRHVPGPVAVSSTEPAPCSPPTVRHPYTRLACLRDRRCKWGRVVRAAPDCAALEGSGILYNTQAVNEHDRKRQKGTIDDNCDHWFDGVCATLLRTSFPIAMVFILCAKSIESYGI